MSNGRKDKMPPAWSRLDNAAKIFPPTAYGSNTGVFRLSCELTEPVDADILQKALDDTLECFPHMRVVLRRGVFWYYLEQTDTRPVVVEEHAPPCTALYHGSRSLLFEVSWWKSKVNIDVFHVLSDGSGAINFFQYLITAYLHIRHPKKGTFTNSGASVYTRNEDGFSKYYKPHGGRRTSQEHAYRIKGSRQPNGGLNILEGVADIREVISAAHRYNVTLTVYLCALLTCAIRGGMRQRDLTRPVVITVPVNLRNYFPTDTARNFFSIIRIPYDFSEESGGLEDIIRKVSRVLASELTPQRLSERMNAFSALEHNPVLCSIPLVLKNPVLQISGLMSDRGETAVLSNIGRFQVPEAYASYIKGFGVFMSTRSMQLCVCTFGDSFHMGFTSAFRYPEIQRLFFKMMADDGIALEIRSNAFYGSDTHQLKNKSPDTASENGE